MIRKDFHRLFALLALTLATMTLNQSAARAQTAASPVLVASNISTAVAVICQGSTASSAATFTSNVVSIAVLAPVPTRAVYRLYNAGDGDHFYTADPAEEAAVAKSGWYGVEGVIGYAPTAAADNTAPVYRLYNPSTGEHLYTADPAERDAVAAGGWNSEGDAWLVFTTPGPGSVPLYRLYWPGGKHFYTTSPAERDLVLSFGFRDEGTLGYLNANP